MYLVLGCPRDSLFDLPPQESLPSSVSVTVPSARLRTSHGPLSTHQSVIISAQSEDCHLPRSTMITAALPSHLTLPSFENALSHRGSLFHYRDILVIKVCYLRQSICRVRTHSIYQKKHHSNDQKRQILTFQFISSVEKVIIEISILFKECMKRVLNTNINESD